MFNHILKVIDEILELPPENPIKGAELWGNLDQMLERVLDVTKINADYHKRLNGTLLPIKTAASKLAQSISQTKHDDSLRDDWKRFAERDLLKLKDELLGLREFMIETADFLKFVCLRAELEKHNIPDPEKLFQELHHTGAISERTWALLMAQPKSWRSTLKNRKLSKQLVKISGWLLDLEEARKERTAHVGKTSR